MEFIDLVKLDFHRYGKNKNLFLHHFRFLIWLRLGKSTNNRILRSLCKIRLKLFSERYGLEIPLETSIGPGFYIGHPFNITINPHSTIGKNVNIHKGVTIGQENRGNRKGAPIIGDEVWIGVNSTIVGKIQIGNNVLVAPNSYVNRDIPDNSIVFGNPCVVKSCIDATSGYINNKIR